MNADVFFFYLLQDGTIDYKEFVAMMQRGNTDLAKKGQKGSTSLKIGYREALSVC